MKGKLVWKHADNISSASDVADGLYSSQENMSDPASEGTDAPQTNNVYSEHKDRDSASDKKGSGSENSDDPVDEIPGSGKNGAGKVRDGINPSDGVDNC